MEREIFRHFDNLSATQAQGSDRKKDRITWKILNSSGLLSPFSIILFTILLCSLPLSALDISKSAIGVASGITIDVAPFGIEQTYFMVQAAYTLPGTLAFSLRPSFSLNSSSKMFRFPLVLNLSNYVDKNKFVLLSCYMGGGLEIYRSYTHNIESLLLTGGVSIALGFFYIHIPVVSAYRSYDTDSDIAITAGFYFQR